MKKHLSISLALLLPALCGGAMANAHAFSPKAAESYFRYAPKAKTPDALFASQAAATVKAASAAPQHTLTETDNIEWLETPDGSTWFCTTVYETEEVRVPGGYGQTETYLTGFEFTIYDSDFKLVGTVKDKIELAEDETRARAIDISPVLTKKFFNSNDKYEIIVGVACNTDQNFALRYHSYAYSIGGEKDSEGYDLPLLSIDGYVTVDFNNARDKWSEDYYIGFLTEYSDPTLDDHLEFLHSYKNIITLYKKAGWGSEPVKYDTIEVQLASMPGEQEDYTPFLIVFEHDGVNKLAVSHYEKPYFIDPAPEDFNQVLEPTPDNNLVIEIYSTGDKELELEQQTLIPVAHDATNYVATFYGIGALRYDGDINYGDIDPSQPSKAAFIVTRQRLIGFNDDYEYSILQYDADGKQLRTITEGMENFVNLSDIKGFEPQCIFIQMNATSGDYTFDAVDLYSGTKVATLPHYIGGMPITANIDRVRVGDSYNWVCSAGKNSSDFDHNTLESVLWIGTDGEINRIDEVNIGQRVAYAQVYISQETLTPYLFNTDSSQEYMYLVKRYNENNTATSEELQIVSTNGSTLMSIGEDETLGVLQNISISDRDTNPRLSISYYNSTTKTFAQEFYDLPLTRFAGGDGTQSNPYLVATAGDLMQVHKEPAAHYLMISDIDALGIDMAPFSGAFSGSFDGDNKFIKNLSIASPEPQLSLFGDLNEGAVIKNVNFLDSRLTFEGEAAQAGLIAVNAKGSVISGVHVYGLEITAPEATAPLIGGLAGKTTNHASVSDCSVSNAVLSAPDGEIGGIAGNMLTGSTINACSFTGSIKGNSNVGGITGELFAAESSITNCHVNADLTANNTVGGIAGSSRRGTIANCHVEGNIEALAAPRWYDYGPCAGGITGDLAPDFGSSETMLADENDEPSATACIYGNFVNLTSLKGFESAGEAQWDGQYDTMHRIVGRTIANYDTSETAENIPTAESGLRDNHAIDALPAVSGEELGASVEGASVNADNLSTDFFTALGFRYGNDSDNPWQAQPEWRPTLYHEAGAIAIPSEIKVRVGHSFSAGILFVSRIPLNEEDVIGGLTVELSNESVAQMTGDYSFADNTLNIGFECMAEGETDITIGSAGTSATVKVTAIPSTGVSEIESAGNGLAIIYNGGVLSAEGCRLSLYNLNGQLMATGENSLSTSQLTSGVYVARATDATGNTSTLKIVLQ